MEEDTSEHTGIVLRRWFRNGTTFELMGCALTPYIMKLTPQIIFMRRYNVRPRRLRTAMVASVFQMLKFTEPDACASNGTDRETSTSMNKTKLI